MRWVHCTATYETRLTCPGQARKSPPRQRRGGLTETFKVTKLTGPLRKRLLRTKGGASREVTFCWSEVFFDSCIGFWK